jgi:hypothetical protein
VNRKQIIGSYTAKGGFQNEINIADKFNNYQKDKDASDWLRLMGYDPLKIENLKAIGLPVRISKKKAIELGATEEKIEETLKYKKADIQLQMDIEIDSIIYRENISLKKANKSANFNQIDKRPVGTYQMMWNFNDSIKETLMKFTGEIKPTSKEGVSLRDKRRWYLDELPKPKVDELLGFFEDNKVLIFSDILRGRGAFAAEWFLITRFDQKAQSADWLLANTNDVINYYSKGKVEVSKRGGLNLCKLRAQRKGGTPDPTSLQFKISPLDIFNI